MMTLTTGPWRLKVSLSRGPQQFTIHLDRLFSIIVRFRSYRGQVPMQNNSTLYHHHRDQGRKIKNPGLVGAFGRRD